MLSTKTERLVSDLCAQSLASVLPLKNIKHFHFSGNFLFSYSVQGNLITTTSLATATMNTSFAELDSHLETNQSAAMSEKCSLEMLLPELQLQILFDADTPEDLHALIQASPRLYQVFLLNKEIILSAVAQRQFHPAVISDALFLAKTSQLEQPLPRETVLELCRAYPSELHGGTVIAIPMSVALCKLASNIRFFIKDYSQNSLPLMKGLGRSPKVDVLPEYGPEDPVSSSRLSDSETGRLQRAFCRFETYRFLFARCSSELDHDIRECAQIPSLTPAEQASLFLQKFPDFQVTEINCVRDYLYRRLRGICNQLEDKAFDTLPPEAFEFDQDGDVENAEWVSGIWLFTNNGKAYQDSHIEHLMSLGLAYIRRIFESTGDQQKCLFIRQIDVAITDHIEREFMTRAFDFLGDNPARGDIPLLAKTDPPFVYEVNAEVELDIPDAWQWAHPRAPPQILVDSDLKGLRDWGYVFWDLGRLRESGILEQRYASFQAAG